jgi:FG-GAP-like repeat
MRTVSGMAPRPSKVVSGVALSLLLLLTALSSLAYADPTIGISQSYRNFGLQAPGSYNPNQDVSKSIYMSPLQISTFRVIVPWDLAGRPATDGRRQEFQHWLNTIKARGAEPFVVFGPTEKLTNIYNASQSTRRIDSTTECDSTPDAPGDGVGCLVAPFAGTYRNAINQFLATWGPGTAGGVRLIGAWNEPNVGQVTMVIPDSTDSAVYLPKSDDPNTPAVDAWTTNRMDLLTASSGASCPSSPTSSNCGPFLAANYWKEARAAMIAACPAGVNCYTVAGEFDSGPDAESYWDEYADKIIGLGSPRPSQISFHAHRDAEELGAHVGAGGSPDNDCRSGNVDWCITHEFNEWLQAKGGVWADRSAMKIWNTETGAAYKRGTAVSDVDNAQNNRFKFLLTLSNNNNVARLYYFNFQGGGQNDRGLIDDGATVNTRARPIWTTVRCRNQVTCPSWSPPGGGADFSGDGKWDLVVRKPDGSLWMYRGNGAGGFATGSGEPIGVSFQAFDTVFASLDFSGDGYGDLIARKPDGSLWMYQGNGAGGLITSYGDSIGAGFGIYDVVIGRGDFSGDGKTDLLARKPDGSLWMYRGNGAGGFVTGNAEWIGAGFQIYDTLRVAGDFSGDGKTDLLARKPDGSMWMYRGNGAGGFATGNGEWIGAGFQIYDKTRVVDFSGDGKVDLVVRKPDGTLWMYRGNGVGGFATGNPESIGAGFQIYDFFSEA